MNRRDLIALFGIAAVTSPFAAHARHATVPMVGVLGTLPVKRGRYFPDFEKGLAEYGYIEGQTIAFDIRNAPGHIEQLPTMAAAMVEENVAAIVPLSGLPCLLAAKNATTTIPIVFLMDGDPVQLGAVQSLRGGNGNITGVALLQADTVMKQLEFLNELAPGNSPLGMFVDPNAEASGFVTAAHTASERLGRPVVLANVKDPSEFDAGFSNLVQQRVAGVVVPGGAIFSNIQKPLADLASKYRIPTVFPNGDLKNTGGLMSYGADPVAMLTQVGRLLGRVLKGTNPGDLPVEQAERIELKINLVVAKALGLTVPQSILVRADEVIE